MRALLAAILSLSLLIGCWLHFYQYATDSLQQICSVCRHQIMTAMEEGDWSTADTLFSAQYQKWLHFQQRALYMLETDTLNNIHASFGKTLCYIRAKDLSNSSGELLALEIELEALLNQNAARMANIF